MYTTLATLALAATAVAAPTYGGFSSPIVVTSASGNAVCVQGNVAVTATTTRNVKLNLPIAANQTVVTQTLIDMIKAGSTFQADVVGGPNTVSGTFNINARICAPAKTAAKSNTVQILTHGVGFDKSYWDVAKGFSYIDAAAAAGYSTFSYDRLGTGLSDHPADANQIVQAPLEQEILHQLILGLKAGTYGGSKYSNVIGVGHSFGSFLTQGITNTYPTDLAAAVFTGFTLNTAGVVPFETALDLTIASQNNPLRFGLLNNGYLVANNIVGNQFAFFAPLSGFPYTNLQIAEATKQTVTYGELITLGNVIAPAASFTGPIDVVNGDSDFPFCDGTCTEALNAQVRAALYPAASDGSDSYIAPQAAHGLNLHYSANTAYSQIQNFVSSNGF